MIVFLCAHVRISISTYILTSIVIYLPYRLTSSDAIIGVVFLFMLINWWVEKHQSFLFNVHKRFLLLSPFFTFFNVFIFFWNVFLHLWFEKYLSMRVGNANVFTRKADNRNN